MNEATLCLNPAPHKEHSYRRRGQGYVTCPGHNNPEPDREPWYDCEEGTADLCPLHAAAPEAIRLLRELVRHADELADYADVDRLGATHAARTFLDSLEGDSK